MDAVRETQMRMIEKSVAALRKEFGESVLGVETFRDQTSVVLDRAALVPACTLLRDDGELRFNRLSALTAVDYWPKEPRFVVVYQLYSIPNRSYLGLRVPLHGQSAELLTLEAVFPSANWPEREVYDMFGIKFLGHSDLRRLLMPYDWQGHPLRKDYPLGYEEVQFSFNHDEIDRKKPYARE
jgi:NADH-quinone oxidoreductase subunit C